MPKRRCASISPGSGGGGGLNSRRELTRPHAKQTSFAKATARQGWWRSAKQNGPRKRPALASQHYGWTGICLGGRPGTEKSRQTLAAALPARSRAAQAFLNRLAIIHLS